MLSPSPSWYSGWEQEAEIFVSAQQPTHKGSSPLQVLTSVFLGGTPVGNPLQLKKPNMTFWALWKKTHWVTRDRMLSVQCFHCYSLARRNTKSQASGEERWPRKNNGLTQLASADPLKVHFLLSCFLWSYRHCSKEPLLSDLTQWSTSKAVVTSREWNVILIALKTQEAAKRCRSMAATVREGSVAHEDIQHVTLASAYELSQRHCPALENNQNTHHHLCV